MPERFDMLGLENNNFLLNSGTLFWLFFLWLFLIVIYVLATIVQKIAFRNSKLKTFLSILSYWIFFNYIIRLLLESYIDLCLTSLINLKLFYWGVSGEKIGTLFSFFVFTSISLFSILVLVFVFRNFRTL